MRGVLNTGRCTGLGARRRGRIQARLRSQITRASRAHCRVRSPPRPFHCVHPLCRGSAGYAQVSKIWQRGPRRVPTAAFSRAHLVRFARYLLARGSTFVPGNVEGCFSYQKNQPQGTRGTQLFKFANRCRSVAARGTHVGRAFVFWVSIRKVKSRDGWGRGVCSKTTGPRTVHEPLRAKRRVCEDNALHRPWEEGPEAGRWRSSSDGRGEMPALLPRHLAGLACASAAVALQCTLF